MDNPESSRTLRRRHIPSSLQGTIEQNPNESSASRSPQQRQSSIPSAFSPDDPLSRLREFLKTKGYQLGPLIGEGSYSKVRRAFRFEPQKQMVALKIISLEKMRTHVLEVFLPREIRFLRIVNHKHLIRLYDIIEWDNKIILVTELAEYGDILHYIKRRGRFNESRARKYFRQIVLGLKYMHDNDMCHRDLKCENIYLTADDNIKIGDFGFCRSCSDPVSGKRILSKTYCGSAVYTAPEVLSGVPYNPKLSDVWSLGCVLYVMVTGCMPPFHDANIQILVRQQMQRRINYPENVPLSLDLKQLIRHMLEPDFLRRANLMRVMKHRWLYVTAESSSMLHPNSGQCKECVVCSSEDEHKSAKTTKTPKRHSIIPSDAAQLEKSKQESVGQSTKSGCNRRHSVGGDKVRTQRVQPRSEGMEKYYMKGSKMQKKEKTA